MGGAKPFLHAIIVCTKLVVIKMHAHLKICIKDLFTFLQCDQFTQFINSFTDVMKRLA